MKSKAAIGDHPIHPMLVPIPIGAFFLALIGDVIHAGGSDPFWYRFSYVCIGAGLAFALLAAVFGLIEYFGVTMSARGKRLAAWHARLNVAVVVLYALSFWMRRGDAALETGRWPLALGTSILGFALLGVSGWLGGNLSYHHKVGVVENKDPEALEIGMREARGGAR
ncbi:MAG: DUF2231 domain-containing protein [Thermoanaerobaculia bacterium]